MNNAATDAKPARKSGIRLAGTRGAALESFWAGCATAAETLAVTAPAALARATAGDPVAPAAPVAAPAPKPHAVSPTEAGFEVVSGRSGRTYLVIPLSMGGAACNCAFGRHSVSIASRCSHVKAVEAFAAKVLAPVEPAKPEPKRCPDCSTERPGFMLVYVCAHDWKRGPRNNCGPDTCARWEVCPGCWGSGFVK